MASISITKQWGHGSAAAKITVTVPCSISNTNTTTTLTIDRSNYSISYPTTGSGSDLTYAKNLRANSLQEGITCKLTCTASTGTTFTNLISFNVPNPGGISTVSITNTTCSWTKQHTAGTKTLRIALVGNGTSSNSGITNTNIDQSIPIPIKTSYTVSYNANGGSGSPATQTKWYGENLTLQAGTTVSKANYVFKCWNTNTSDSGSRYASGASYTGNANLALYAIWNPKVKYDANGGTGAPSQQTKTFNTNLTLQSGRPTRTNFKFIGWNTNASASTATYQPSGTYTGNTYLYLYAIWKRSYDEPKITVTGYRANSQGNPDDEGTYLQVNINWSIYDSTTAGESANSATITVSCNNVSTTLTPTGISSNNWISSNNTSTLLNANLDKDTKYNATIVLTDKGGSSHSKTVVLFVPTAFYPIDILPGGTGIAFGGASTAQGKMEIFYDDVLLGFDEDTTSDLYKAINTLGWISEVIV